MSAFVYPASLPGLTFDNTRSPNFNTGIQQALSGKESALAYQLYPIMEFELQYEFLTGASQSSSDIRALLGLFMAMKGQADDFLFNDPEFNTVANMTFATTDTTSTSYQTTATYQNTGGPGGPELIQNFNGAPTFFANRFGFNELMLNVTKQNLLLQSQAFDNASWTKTNVTVTPNTTVAPDSTVTMDSIVESTSTNVQHSVSQSVAVPSGASIYTVSYFVKPSARSWVLVNLIESLGGTSVNVWFNLSTGAIGSIVTGANWSGASATITPVNNGGFRITVTAAKTNAAIVISAGLYSSTGDTISTYTGTTSTIATIVWGAQFENFSFASMYLPSTTAIVTQTDYALGATGIITVPAPFAQSGWTLNWSGSFFYRCRFTEDKMTVSQFVNKFWENKQVVIRQRKL